VRATALRPGDAARGSGRPNGRLPVGAVRKAQDGTRRDQLPLAASGAESSRDPR